MDALFATLPPSEPEPDDAVCDPVPAVVMVQQFVSYGDLLVYVQTATAQLGFGIAARTTKTDKAARAAADAAESSAAIAVPSPNWRVNGYFQCEFYNVDQQPAAAAAAGSNRHVSSVDVFCGPEGRRCILRVRWSRRSGVHGLTNPKQLGICRTSDIRFGVCRTTVCCSDWPMYHGPPTTSS